MFSKTLIVSSSVKYLLIMHCEVCFEGLDEVNANNISCGYRTCTKFSHKSCLNRNQVSKSGYYYCKIHIKEIPPNHVRVTDENQENAMNVNDMQPENEVNKEKEVVVTESGENIAQKENKNNKRRDSDIIVVETVQNLHSPIKNKDNKVVPYDDGDDTNPFANFACDKCEGPFTKSSKGVLCKSCRTTFHKTCLNEAEKINVKKSEFFCQHCIQDIVRIDRFKKSLIPASKSKEYEKPGAKDRIKSFINSTSKSSKSKKSSKINLCASSSSSSSSSSISSLDSSSESTDSERDSKNQKLYAKYKKLKKLLKNNKAKSSSDESSSSSEDERITQENAMLSLYKLTKEERNKAKFEKLPIVEHADTRWSVFFELFKKSRKFYSAAENILRLQKSIRSKEILEIGGISLFDPRTYWQALKLIDKRLCHSYNLLQKETDEIVKIKKLKFDSDPKRVIEFINKIINYSHIVEKYGNKKHKIDDRIISHIGNIMPNSIATGWHKTKSKLESKDKSVSLKHIAEYLSKQVSHLTSKIQGQELDPWRENFSGKFNYSNKRSYHINEKKEESVDSNNFCWLHKTKSHSAFECSKLWAISGQEVTKLARENNICTFCGYKRHKTCHADKNLSCKIEGCTYKHNILFCFRRKGKDDKRSKNSRINRRNIDHKSFNNNNNNVTKNLIDRFSKSRKKLVKNNNNHREDESNKNASTSQSEGSEVEIPQSSFYMNKPPKTLKLKKDNSKSKSKEQNSNSHFRSDEFTLNSLYNIKSKHTASCILGIIVVKVVQSNKCIALLLDSGSTVSLIDQKIADNLELKGIWNPLRLNWSNNISRMDYGSRIVNVQTSTMHATAKQFNLYLRTVKDLNMHEQPFDSAEMQEFYPHLRSMHLTSYSKIDGIIGLDNMWAFEQQMIFKPKHWKPHMPYGIRSPLGDYVVGNVNQLEDIYACLKNSNDNSQFNANFFVHELKLTEEEEKEYEELEKSILGSEYNKVDIHDNDSYNDSLALDILNKKVRKADNNINYEAPLL